MKPFYTIRATTTLLFRQAVLNRENAVAMGIALILGAVLAAYLKK